MRFRIFGFNNEAIIMKGDVIWVTKEIRNSEKVVVHRNRKLALHLRKIMNKL
jgi:hypothetical protein